MAISGLLTTQQLSIAPENFSESDDPTGTFAATRLTVGSTSPALFGGKVLMKQGATTEEARILRVASATQVIVEKLAGTYTTAATVTFMGASNPGDPIGHIIARNSVGFKVYASKNRAETFWNNLALDMNNVASFVDNAVTSLTAYVDGEVADLTTYVNNQVTLLTNYVNDQVAALTANLTALVKTAVPTGTPFYYLGSVAPDSYVLASAKTIGPTGSAATERANDDTKNLYLHLWNNISDAWCPVTGGRGATAEADWAAGKLLQVPDGRGVTMIGMDNIGGTAAGRVTAVSTGGNLATTLGARGGTEAVGLTSANNGPHTHSVSGATAGPNGVQAVASSPYARVASVGTSTSGSGTPHNNMQPWMACNIIIKL